MTDREMLEKARTLLTEALSCNAMGGEAVEWNAEARKIVAAGLPRVLRRKRAAPAPATEHPAAKRWQERPAEEHRFIDRKLRDGCMAGLGVNAADALEALAERECEER